MRNKMLHTIKYMAAILLLFILMGANGCQLAQPERGAPESDEFIGFHIVPEKLGEVDEEGFQQIGDNDRTHWVEYGEDSIEVDGFGNLSFPRQILIGAYNEDTRRYDFPGKEGFNCFLAVRTDENAERYINGYTDMTETSLHMKVTDEGEENILTAALYTGTVENEEDYDTILTAYRVFQMADGTVYLDGTGNSYGGGGFTINERSEHTTTVNGEVSKQILDITFSLKDAERHSKVEVVWYGGDDGVLLVEELPLTELEGEYDLTPPDGAAWFLVRETDIHGRVTRSACTPAPNGEARHELIVLDELGIGRKVGLNWTAEQ